MACGACRFLETLESLVDKNLPAASKRSRRQTAREDNVYELRRELLASIPQTFAESTALDGPPGARRLCALLDDLKADLKSIAASGWGPELIPDDDILAEPVPGTARRDGAESAYVWPSSPRCSPPPTKRTTKTATTPACSPGDEVKGLLQNFKEATVEAKLAKKEAPQAATGRPYTERGG